MLRTHYTIKYVFDLSQETAWDVIGFINHMLIPTQYGGAARVHFANLDSMKQSQTSDCGFPADCFGR